MRFCARSAATWVAASAVLTASGCVQMTGPVLPPRTEAVIATLGRPIAERPRQQAFAEASADALAASPFGEIRTEPFAMLAEPSAWQRLLPQMPWSPRPAAVGTGWLARPASLSELPAADAILARNPPVTQVFPPAHVNAGFAPSRCNVSDQPPGLKAPAADGAGSLPTLRVPPPADTPHVPGPILPAPTLPGVIRTRPIVVNPPAWPDLATSAESKPLDSVPTAKLPRLVLEVYDILDPAPVASELQYLIRVTNGEASPLESVRLRIDCPQNLQPLAIADLKATVKAGVVTSAAFALAAGECRSFRLKVRTLAKGETVLRVAVLDAADIVLRAEEEKTQVSE